MKYLKGSLAIFAIAFVFSVINVNAKQTLTLKDITIPIFSGTYLSTQANKDIDNLQYIKKTSCVDNLSGDGRVILAKADGMLTGMKDSAWVEAKPNTNVSFGSNSKTIGLWRVDLKSNKSLPTTATFNGVWTIDS